MSRRAPEQPGRTPRPGLVVVGPLPPPLHGVTVSTSLVLANERLRERFEVEHLDTSDHRTGENIGRWDFDNVRIAIQSTLRLARALSRRRGLVYLPISQNRSAFLRDSLFILLAAARGWVVTIHLRGSEFPAFYRSQGPLGRRWIRFVLGRVDSAAVMGRSLRFVFGDMIVAERIAVVHNGTPEPMAQADPAASRSVLFLSNLRRRKGLLEALAAARIVARARPDVGFRFVGSWESDELRREAARVAPEAVSFEPPVAGEAKDHLFASAAMLLFTPVEPEGHPRVVLEAMAAGLPVVATDQGAIAETVQHGVTGHVLPVADPARLAAAVLEVLDDDDLRRRMGHASRARYLERFSQERADEMLATWLHETWEARGGR